VLELAAAEGCSLKTMRVLGAPGKYIGHNSRDAQLMEAGINADKIAEMIKKMSKA